MFYSGFLDNTVRLRVWYRIARGTLGKWLTWNITRIPLCWFAMSQTMRYKRYTKQYSGLNGSNALRDEQTDTRFNDWLFKADVLQNLLRKSLVTFLFKICLQIYIIVVRNKKPTFFQMMFYQRFVNWNNGSVIIDLSTEHNLTSVYY